MPRKITNAERYIESREPDSIMHTIAKTVPDKCPIHVITGMGLTRKCQHGSCKEHIKEWLKKKE